MPEPPQGGAVLRKVGADRKRREQFVQQFGIAQQFAGGPPGSAEQDGDRFVEIWNLVFMQFERSPEGTLTPLPKPSIDTGAGLERLSSVVQGKRSNYDTDLFRNIIAAVEKLSGKRYGGTPEGEDDVSMRVIAASEPAIFIVVPKVQ